MVSFKTLRLQGFKSFVDKSDLEILPGLTGIVGPNGCGKSNLVEALRWVMGASSARLLRGGSMDDVIFNGTSRRPARNHAEVSLVLDNSDLKAPAPYTSIPEIEIVRRIDREQGSGYKINGRNARARDVQNLFADLTAGAHSAAMVGQGRVTGIIHARPLERRILLEEAAGVTGVYSRRQEAEQRLKAAEENLKQVEDILTRLGNQAGSLKRQADQAAKYRTINEAVLKLEQIIDCLIWQESVADAAKVNAQRDAVEKAVAEALLQTTQLGKSQDDISQSLKPLQMKVAEARASFQNLKLTLQRLESEEERIVSENNELQSTLAQLSVDLGHETANIEEISANQQRLETEAVSLQEEISGATSTQQELVSKRDSKNQALATAEAAFEEALKADALASNELRDVENSLQHAGNRLQQLESRKTQLLNDIQSLEARHKDSADSSLPDVAKIEAEEQALLKQFDTLRDKIEALREKSDQSRKVLTEAKAELSQKEMQADSLRRSLDKSLASQKTISENPVIAAMRPKKGMETALARALGEALQGVEAEDAPHGWSLRRDSVSLQADTCHFPEGLPILADFVAAPASLQLALHSVAVAPDEETARRVATDLRPGQAVVTESGFFYRWDGYYTTLPLRDSSTDILAWQTELDTLDGLMPKLKSAVESADKKHVLENDKLVAAEQELNATRSKSNQISQDLREARQKHQAHETANARLTAELESKKTSLDLLKTELDIAMTEHKQFEKNRNEISKKEETSKAERQETLALLKESVETARTEVQNAVTCLQLHIADQARREARARAVGDERVNLSNRLIRAKEQLSRFEERKEQTTQRIAELKDRPATIAKEREAAQDKLNNHDSSLETLEAELANSERAATEGASFLKNAEAKLMEAKENAARLSERLLAAKERRDSQAQSIEEKFGVTAESLAARIDTKETPASLQFEHTKLVRGRDALGAVNLRAEIELEEITAEITKLETEKNDLEQAIGELRTAVSKLNQEARDRLMTSFESINHHFQRLFATVFRGGQAHLALVESDDPLSAGLEIFAQPPGKTLQSLSLLSGGEQTLTAIALIFAMFLTNPAPLCVLDEIDAPLDDANVDRVCDLLQEIASSVNTRFLIITHHRLTMARMDRLYGVTMAEKGVSQLLSLELQPSFAFLQAAE